MRVFDRQRMQVEFFFHAVEFVRLGIAHRHPHDAVVALQVRVDFIALDIRDFFAIPVGNAVDDHLKFSCCG